MDEIKIGNICDTMAVVAQSVAQPLGSLLLEEAKLLHGVKGKVKQLEKELAWMQGFLHDVDKMGQHDDTEVIRILVSEVRELVYDAEDTVEKYIHGVAVSDGNRRGNICGPMKRFCRFVFHLWGLHKVGSDIDELIARISRLKERRKTYVVKSKREEEGSSSSARVVLLRKTYSHTVDEDVVMREESVRLLVDELVDSESGSKVVGIVGMGGLGKTTLAREVYQHRDIRNSFDCQAWVYVSQQPQKRRILEEILQNFNTGEDIYTISENALSLKVRKVLKEKKCLIVLDDIWHKEIWAILVDALFPILFKNTRKDDSDSNQDVELESKLMLTSRNNEVVEQEFVKNAAFIHRPEFLSDYESWMLLCKKAFPRMNQAAQIDDEMENLGQKMLQHCGGLPISIVLLGGILSTRVNLQEWKEVAENIDVYLSQRVADKDTMGVTQVLELSYNDLPFYLKSCFLSLGYFAENSEIPTSTLYQFWLAEGLVQIPPENEPTTKNVCTYDIAEQYLNELVGRCMVQVKEIYYNGRIKTCVMHDAMRSLCLKKARKEKFLDAVPTKVGDGNPPDSSLTYPRTWTSHRVVCNLERKDVVDSFFSEQQEYSLQLRSLVILLPNSCNTIIFKTWFSKMHKAFKLLRVLSLEGGQIMKVPNEFGSCIHLRYLKLNLCCLEVPSFVWKLIFLQTLHLQSSNQQGIRIPNKLWRLKRLVHLYLPQVYEVNEKLKLSEPSQMVTLVNINIKHFYEKDLQQMSNLRILSFVKHDRDPMDTACVNTLLKSPIITSRLQENPIKDLYIKGEGLNKDPKILTANPNACIKVLHIIGVINQSPDSIIFPNTLVALDLYGCEVQGDLISQLHLSGLKNLFLGWKAIKGNKIVLSVESFKSLKYLEIYWQDHLNMLDVEGELPDDCCLTLRCPENLNPNYFPRLQHKGTKNVIPLNFLLDMESPISTLQGALEVKDVVAPQDASSQINPLLINKAPGGPSIPDLLLGFEGHIAHAIWANMDCTPVELACHIEQLREWVLDDSPWCDIVRRSGLSHLQNSMYDKHNGLLINAFVERWHPETNSFHMPFGKMTITLHDVCLLLDLNIAGDVLTVDIDPKHVWREVKEELGIIADDHLKTYLVEMNGFVETFRLVEHCQKKKVQEKAPDVVATCFLLNLLCSTLFTDKSHDKLSILYLPILRDHNRVHTLSWGSAALSYLYRCLGEASRKDCKQMYGCITLLEAWIYAYFPIFRPMVSDDWDRDSKPFSSQWRGAIFPTLHLEYRELLDVMRVNQVDWMPYGELDFSGPLAPSKFRGLIPVLETYEPYMSDRVARQFGRQQQVPAPIIMPQIALRGVNSTKYKVVYGIGECPWNLRSIESLSMDLIGPEARNIGDVTNEYFEWYAPRTHLFILPQSAHPLNVAKRACEYLTPWFSKDKRQHVPFAVHLAMMIVAMELGYLGFNKSQTDSRSNIRGVSKK